MPSFSISRRTLLSVAVSYLTMPGVPAQAAPPSQVLRMAFGDASPPVYWKPADSTTEAQGLLVELMAEVCRLAGLHMQANAFPLPRVQRMVEHGEADGMVNVVTPARLAYALASAEPLIVGNVSIFAHKDNPALERLKTVRTLDELAAIPVSVAALIGSGWTKKNLEARGMKVFYASGTVTNVRMLIAKRADVVVDLAANIHWILKDEADGDSIVELPHSVDSVGWNLMISKHSPFANEMPALDRAIAEMKSRSAYRGILKKYRL